MGKGYVGKWVYCLLLLALSGLAQAGTHHYYYTDPQGTVLAKADASGNIIATYDYAPYGTAAPNMSPAPNGPGYTGHVNDPDTGLVYMQSRYYDPAAGRFISADPHPVTAGALFFINRYVYGNDAPSRYTDIFGDKPGDKWATPELAAYDALQFINATSIRTNHEYLGYIIVSGKQFVATQPVQQAEDHGNAAMPTGQVVGDYHTHGQYSYRAADGTFVTTDAAHDTFNSDFFSKSDIDRYTGIAKKLGSYRGYLATPSGKYLMFFPGMKPGDLAQIAADQLAQIAKQQQQRQQQAKEPPREPPPPPNKDDQTTN